MSEWHRRQVDGKEGNWGKREKLLNLCSIQSNFFLFIVNFNILLSI